MPYLIAIAAIDVYPQKRPLIEADKALLVEIDLLIMSIGVVEKGLNYGVASGREPLP
jgi:hypothetical protein